MSMLMEKAEDIDEMSLIHIKFVTRLQERAILSKELKPIHKAIIEMLDLGVQYAEVISRTDVSDILENKKKTTRATKRKTSQQVQEAQPDSASDIESGDGESPMAAKGNSTPKSSEEALLTIDKEFTRLMPFITAGLKSVGRVGSEPILGQLAERLEWDGITANVERSI